MMLMKQKTKEVDFIELIFENNQILSLLFRKDNLVSLILGLLTMTMCFM